MADLIRLLPMVLAALGIAAFFLLATVVLVGTVAACVRWRRARRQVSPPRRIAGDRATPVRP